MNINTSNSSAPLLLPPQQGATSGFGPGAASPEAVPFVPSGPGTFNTDNVLTGVPDNWRSLKPTAEDASLLSKTMRFIKSAYERVKTARANLRKALSNAGRKIMDKLFGAKDGKLSENQIAQIDQKLGAVEDKLKRMLDDNGADIRFFGAPDRSAKGWAGGVAIRNGDSMGQPEIGLSRSLVKFSPNEELLQAIIHEASHSAAGTADYWYVSNARAGLGRDMEVASYNEKYFSPGSDMTFDHRVNNADTIAMAALRLGEAAAVDESADAGSVENAAPVTKPRQTQTATRTSEAASRVIERLEQAKAKLYAPWDEATTARMYRLYGREGKGGVNGFSDADIARIAQRLDDLIATLKDTRDGQRQPQLRQDAANLDDAALEAELVRDATLASGASDRWNVRETPGGLVNAPYGSSEYIDPEDISLDDALQNGYTLRYTIDALN